MIIFKDRCDPSIDLTVLPSDCGKFRRCSGVLIIMECPANLVFDNKIKACNHPENVAGPCGTLKYSIYEN